MMSDLSLSLLILAFTVSISEADYEFAVHFYEFHNPLGLQCGECGSGGPPACCDDVNRTENCNNEVVGPLRCDTRFRFTLRPFGASVDTAPNSHFPHYNAGNFIPNSITFTEKFQNLPNPYTITNATEWTGRVQFFIDALDRVVPHRSDLETEVIINRFPIDLELELGANFTNRAIYTGIYNISDVEFDMSFRVQCSQNYYGPNCTTFCEPVEGVYTCDSEGIPICLKDNRNFCTQCPSSQNPSPSCAMCLDPSTNCTTCRSRSYDPSSNCTSCLGSLDPQTNCTKCLPGFIQMGNSCTRRVESTEEPITTETVDLIDHTDGGLNLALVGGVVGGGLAALIVIIILILCILKVVIQKRKKTKHDTSDAASCLGVAESFTYTKKTASGCSSIPQHDFNNPLYGPASAPPATQTVTTNPDEKYPMEQLLEVPNPYYGEVSDSASREGDSKQGSQTSLDNDAPRSRLATFPYVMDGAENAVSNASTTCTPRHQQQRERVKHVVYETTDNIASGKPTKIENSMYDTADNACGKPAKAEDGMYDTADNVCGKPVGTEGGKKEITGVVPQGEEHYDDIKTGGATAATYDDVIVPDKKSSAGVKVSGTGGTASAAVYDDILTSNTSALYDDVQIIGIQALYDDVIKTTKSPSAVSVPTVGGGSDEYDDVVKGPASGAAAKPNNNFSKGEQPFDNEVYSAPYSTTIPANPGPNYSTYMNSS